MRVLRIVDLATIITHRRILISVMLAIHLVLLAVGAWCHSPTWDEVGHLPSGIHHWRTGSFRLYRVNPPLVRMVAALPVLGTGADMSWVESAVDPWEGRPEWVVGRQYIDFNHSRAFLYFTVARWACMPFSIVGAAVCYLWARDLYGNAAGLLAMGLWCFSPNILAHAQMLTPDAGATALGLAAFYVFWRWLTRPAWVNTLPVGLMLGLALLTKATWVILFGLWPFLWCIWRWLEFGFHHQNDWLRQGGQLVVILLLGVNVLNLGYAFEGTGTLLRDFRFESNSLGGSKSSVFREDGARNRFADSSLGAIPVPLPAHYVLGIDRQKTEFEEGFWSYLRGEWRKEGWWYYYLYALLIKVPIGTWLVILLAAFVTVLRRGYVASWRDELFLLTPIAVILTLVSSQTGFNHHMRYVLPIFPFVFVWTSKVAQAVPLRHVGIAWITAVAFLWSLGSSLFYFPHSLAYFNELVGGPSHGHEHLLDSNIDWGQDLLLLKRWMGRHPDASPMAIAYSLPDWLVDPADVGLHCPLPPVGPHAVQSSKTRGKLGPLPGWYAIFVRPLRERDRKYDYFLHFEPIARIGYSVNIYDISLAEANRVRCELGLPQLSNSLGDGIRVLDSGDDALAITGPQGVLQSTGK